MKWISKIHPTCFMIWRISTQCIPICWQITNNYLIHNLFSMKMSGSFKKKHSLKTESKKLKRKILNSLLRLKTLKKNLGSIENVDTQKSVFFWNLNINVPLSNVRSRTVRRRRWKTILSVNMGKTTRNMTETILVQMIHDIYLLFLFFNFFVKTDDRF